MHVEFSLLYKILSIIEMRSKIFKAKGEAAVWFQNSFEHCWHPFYGQSSRQLEIVVDIFFITTLEFLCQLNVLKFPDNHAHVTWLIIALLFLLLLLF